ncbi:MAG TPA: GDSL-type esterase/lipase family protein [Puia sp.]|nr:GDSL-type esterase/lipase family protein [Puia sp.]
MKYLFLFFLAALTGSLVRGQSGNEWFGERLFEADNPMIQYMGRIDASNPKLPRFWNPGVVVRFRFGGAQCRIVLHDQVPDDKVHNYIVVLVGGQLGVYRVKLGGQTDTLTILGNGKALMDGQALKSQVQSSSWSLRPDPHGNHLVTICKATEGIGWMEFGGVYAEALLPPPDLPDRKIECIGNSITCGFGDDNSGIPCGQGQWFDQSNAWMSYGALTARALKAQWQLTAVSGIGLIHSCCNMTITMPGVFDRMDPRGNQGNWDFSRYQPDVVTVCLGQNDGIQDSVTFCSTYVRFVGHLRQVYPKARIVLLTSPMGNAELTAVLKRYINGVVEASGDAQVSDFFFSRQWTSGCAGHPDMREQLEIARELTGYLKKLMGW